MLLMEFEFELAFKFAKTHYMPDLLSRVIMVAKHAISIPTLDGLAKTPTHLVHPIAPFLQWGMNFVGPIKVATRYAQN
jgi:hypothetical protein